MTFSMKMQDVREEAWEEAREVARQTQEKNIQGMIRSMKQYGIPVEQITQMVREAFELSLADAEAKVQRYWET